MAAGEGTPVTTTPEALAIQVAVNTHDIGSLRTMVEQMVTSVTTLSGRVERLTAVLEAAHTPETCPLNAAIRSIHTPETCSLRTAFVAMEGRLDRTCHGYDERLAKLETRVGLVEVGENRIALAEAERRGQSSTVDWLMRNWFSILLLAAVILMLLGVRIEIPGLPKVW
jgi:hypothetical protein